MPKLKPSMTEASLLHFILVPLRLSKATGKCLSMFIIMLVDALLLRRYCFVPGYESR